MVDSKMVVTFEDGSTKTETLSVSEAMEMEQSFVIGIATLVQKEKKFVKKIRYVMNEYIMTITENKKKESD